MKKEMKKEIFFEINRINEIMGLSVLSEAPVPPQVGPKIINTIRSVGDDIWRWVVRDTDEINRILNRTARNAANLTDDEIKIIIRNLTDDGIRNLAEASLNNNTIWRAQTQSNFIDTFVNNIVNDPKSYNKWMSELRKGRLTFWGNYRSYDEMPENVRKLADNISELLKKRIDESIQIDNPTSWKKIQDTIRSTKGFTRTYDDVSELPKEIIENIKNTYGAKWFRSQKVFLQDVKDMVKGEETLIDELLSTIKSLDLSSGNPNEIIVLMKRIDSLMLEVTKKRKENFRDITEWLAQNDKQGLLQPLRLQPVGDGFAKALAISNGSAYKELQSGLNTLFTRRREALNQIYDVVWPGRWLSKTLKTKYGKDTYFGNIIQKWKSIITGPEFKRLRSEFISGQTKTGKEWVESAKRLGVPNAIIDSGIEYVYNWLVLSFIAAAFDFATDVLGKLASLLPYIREWSLVKKQAAQWDSKFKNKKIPDNDMEEWQQAINGVWAIIKDVGSYIGSNSTEFQRVIPGFWDDISAFWLRVTRFEGYLESLFTDTRGTEIAGQLEQQGDTIVNNIQNRIDSLRTGEPLRDITIPRSDSTSVTPTPKGFENFLRGLGLTGNLRSDSTGTDSEGKDWYWDQEANTFQPL